MKQNRTPIEQMFNVDNEDYVSKSALKAKAVQLNQTLMYFFRELFYADPYHQVFKKVPEAELAPLRTMAILRKGR